MALASQVEQTGEEPILADPMRPTIAEVNAYMVWSDQQCDRGALAGEPDCTKAMEKATTVAMQFNHNIQ
jgi:hypothetical protein